MTDCKRKRVKKYIKRGLSLNVFSHMWIFAVRLTREFPAKCTQQNCANQLWDVKHRLESWNIWKPKRAQGKYVPSDVAVQPNRSCTHVAAHRFGHGRKRRSIVWNHVTCCNNAEGVTADALKLRAEAVVSCAANEHRGSCTHVRHSRFRGQNKTIRGVQRPRRRLKQAKELPLLPSRVPTFISSFMGWIT